MKLAPPLVSIAAGLGVMLCGPEPAPAQIYPVITQYPIDRTVQAGGTATFSADASFMVSVYWEVSTDGGKTFTGVNDGGVYGGATAKTLTITGAAATMSGFRYRANFTYYDDYTYPFLPFPVLSAVSTNAATLTVTAPPAADPASADDAQQAYTLAGYACWCAYEAYLAGDGSISTLYAAYLAWLATADARALLAADDLGGARAESEAACLYAYYAWLYSLADYSASGSGWSYYANSYSYYAYCFALLGSS